MNRETRKVQVTGKSTFIISLPKKWVTKVRLASGDTVVLTPRSDGSLLLYPGLTQASSDARRLGIDAGAVHNGTLTRQFIGAYLAGFELIEVSSKTRLTPDVHDQLRRLTQGVIGPQIIDETPSAVTLKVLLDTGDYTPAQGVRRMHTIVREMLQGAAAALVRRDSVATAYLRSREEDVDKTYWLIVKQCNLIVRDLFFADRLGIQPQQAVGYLLVARCLERIGDHAMRLHKYMEAAAGHPELASKAHAAAGGVVEALDRAMQSFLHRGLQEADAVIVRAAAQQDAIEGLRAEVLALKAASEETMALAYLVDSLDRALAYATDIAEVAVDQYFVKSIADPSP